MNQREDKTRAVDALATVQNQQDKVRRGTRVPWWWYPGMFLLITVVTGVNDFLGNGGAQLEAAIVLVVLVIVFAVVFAGRTAPLDRTRGAQPRRTFAPPVFIGCGVVGAVGAWVLARYGAGLASQIAGMVGTTDYPYTVLGIIYGVAFTVLFALAQIANSAYQRRTSQ